MEFTVVEGWLHLLAEWRYQLGSRVPERRGTRVSAFLCSEKGFLCGEPPTGFFICDCPVPVTLRNGVLHHKCDTCGFDGVENIDSTGLTAAAAVARILLPVTLRARF